MDKQEAIKILKEFHDTSALFSVRTALETVFPELKEGEDEKIRKTLIEYFNAYPKDYFGGLKKSYILAWLEKQGEKRSILNVPPREVILSIWDLGNEWKELTNGSISTEYGTQLDYIQKHWTESEYYLREKQDEQTINQPDFEIPFGAKDSELIEESYYIPKGYHAEISKDKVTIKKGEQRPNSQNAQDLIEKYVSDHADCRWLDASELEQLLNDFVLEYDVIKNREYEQQCKVSNDGNNR